jgi:coenzyme F420-reducing hydrogenase gamma subunit
MVDGMILPVVWFEGSVNSEVYLEQVLKGTVWPAVMSVAKGLCAVRGGFNWTEPAAT